MRKRILICGNAGWPDAKPIFDTMYAYTEALTDKGVIFISGMCSGADAIAYYLTFALGAKCDEYPWSDKGKAKIKAIMGEDYEETYRNQWMLDSGVDVCHAYAYDLRTSLGTQDMVNRCLDKGGIPCFWNDGKITRRIKEEVTRDTNIRGLEVVHALSYEDPA